MDQGAVVLRAAGGGDASRRQQGGLQVDGVERADIGQGEGQGDRFSGVNRAVDGSAFIGQNRAGVDDLRGRADDGGDVGCAVVALVSCEAVASRCWSGNC